MVEANIKIIEELKSFLTLVSNDLELKKIVTQSEKYFTRDRKLNLERIVGLIINLPKRSLSIEIQEFFDILGKGDKSTTKGAFCLQRTKLQASFFEAWNQWLVSCFYHYYGNKAKRWKGYLIQAVDGSTAYLINKKEVIEHFGTQDNQYVSVPMARIMQVQDVLNDITVSSCIRPIKESEQAIISTHVSSFYKDSITLFDRGYPSYALMFMMIKQETPRNFVMRCKVGFNKEVKDFMNSKKASKIIELKPNENAIATLLKHCYIVTVQTSIKIRMVKVKLSSGQTEVLLTNLYDEQQFAIDDLKYLYGLRWGIETAFNKQKNQQQMEQFSGHRVICIQQDFAAGIFVANIQSLIEKQSETYLSAHNIGKKYQYKINRNVSWASLKQNIVKLFLNNNHEQILQVLQKAFERNLEPIRPGRQYPHIRKIQRTKGKYQTLTNYKRAI